MIPLILSAIIAINCQNVTNHPHLSISVDGLAQFYPTIDGAREELPYIEAQVPYVLGISVPPPDSVYLAIWQVDVPIYTDYCQGTFEITTITSELPVQFYDADNNYLGQIVPEPATIMLMLGLITLKQIRKTLITS